MVQPYVKIAVKALGKPLPPGAVVHHIDLNRENNRNDNLLICPNASYHRLIHYRLRALRACGNPQYRRCYQCKQWDAPDTIHNGYHRAGLCPTRNKTPRTTIYSPRNSPALNDTALDIKAIKKLLIDRDMRINDLVNALGGRGAISQPTLSRYVNGRGYNPKIQQAIAEALGVPLAAILEEPLKKPHKGGTP